MIKNSPEKQQQALHLKMKISFKSEGGESNQSSKSTFQPQTYFDLIRKVGTDGPYQRNLFILFFCNWFIAAILLLQTGFLFMNNSFDCINNGLIVQNCNQAICKLNVQDREKFIQQIQLKTLTTQFGPFNCDDEYILSFAKSFLFTGSLFGYLFFLFFSDNFGRKFSILLTWGSCCLGIILLISAQNIQMACAGLFLAGSGCEAAIRVNMAIFAQIFDYYKRQKYSIALQLSFGLGGIVVAGLYFFVKDWRILNIFSLCAPSLIIFIIFIFYLQKTPKFVVKKGVQKALKALNRIGKINRKKSRLIKQQDIERVKQNEATQEIQFSKKATILDIFRYESLRVNSICICLIFFAMSYLYFQPTFLIDQYGFDPYISQLVISISQLIAYSSAIPFITKLKRVKTGIICYSIIAIVSFILVIQKQSQNCEGVCAEYLIQLFCLFILRFATCFYFSVLFLYVNQLFPASIRGIGFGVASAFGAVSSSLGNIVITELTANNISPHMMNIPLALMAIICLMLTPQTLNKALKFQIQQIQQLKAKFKQNNTSQIEEQDQSLYQESDNIQKKEKLDEPNQQKVTSLM